MKISEDGSRAESKRRIGLYQKNLPCQIILPYSLKIHASDFKCVKLLAVVDKTEVGKYL